MNGYHYGMKETYYIIILENDTQNLNVVSLGECLSEDDALTEANKYSKKNKANIIWTCSENSLKSLKESLEKYDKQL